LLLLWNGNATKSIASTLMYVEVV